MRYCAFRMAFAYPRLAGTVVPVFALRHAHDFGIGDTQAVREAIDFCADSNLGLLQLLPVNETGQDNSPYNAISSVALDPVYLTLTPETVPGLRPEMVSRLCPDTLRAELQSGSVQYQKVKLLKLDILSEAYVEFEAHDLVHGTEHAYEFQSFVDANMPWLAGYTLFRTLLNEYDGNALWHEWSREHQDLVGSEVWLAQAPDRKELIRYRQFTAYVQWVAWKQWLGVRAWADQKRVRLIGDIPFGISRYSADVWSERALFDLTWSGGAPPEPLFASGEFVRRWGQNWGIPLYDWEAHRAQDYAWWRHRISATCKVFHAFRIDHVLGLFRLYSFPWQPQQDKAFLNLTPEEAKVQAGGRVPHFIPRDDETEKNAALNCAEGEALLRMIQQAAGNSTVVAEDLGVVPPYVGPLLQKLGMPGFWIPQFKVDPVTGEFFARDKIPAISIATWGTHDHAPLRGWYEELTRQWRGPDGHASWLQLQRIMRFLGLNENEPPEWLTDPLHHTFLSSLLESESCWVIFVISDIFGIDLRFNQPGTAMDDNWTQRLARPLAEYAADPAFIEKLKFLRETVASTGRLPGGLLKS